MSYNFKYIVDGGWEYFENGESYIRYKRALGSNYSCFEHRKTFIFSQHFNVNFYSL